MKVLKRMRKTCPFREGSKYKELRELLTELSLKTARICHSTGGPNAINEKGTSKPAAICRGSRNFQLGLFYSMGFISAPTDEAWNAKCKEMGIKPDCQNETDE